MLVLLESLALVFVVYMLFNVVFYKNKVNMEIMSSYECGFDPHSLTRLTFSYRFFLIAILFIIFDVEVSLLLPVPFMMKSSLGLWVFYLFIFILLVGLMYEYYYGSLDWMKS